MPWPFHATANSWRWATAGRTEHLKLLDLPSRRELAVLSGHTTVHRLADFSPDSQRLASASADHTIRIWDNGLLGRNCALCAGTRTA
jgi:WD40 repeat protein